MNDEERKRESDAWNNWKPGSGRKGWSPFNKPLKTSNSLNHELFRDEKTGKVDWNAWSNAIAKERGDG